MNCYCSLANANSDLWPTNFSHWTFLCGLITNDTENTVSKTSSVAVHWFGTTETCLLRHCLEVMTSFCSSILALSHHVPISLLISMVILGVLTSLLWNSETELMFLFSFPLVSIWFKDSLPLSRFWGTLSINLCWVALSYLRYNFLYALFFLNVIETWYCGCYREYFCFRLQK
jgi:hypothetical protein